jgi:PIN domain nuclease of toxin-antitoxin system
MKILLDTHALIWFVDESPELAENARNVISDRNSERLVSIASLWEMAIKLSIGKLELELPFDEFISQHLPPDKVSLMAISIPHLLELISLPFHHRDPFDRLIIAQALSGKDSGHQRRPGI